MRGILIQPPLADPSMPPLGLAYLSNALSKASIEHLVLDANLDYWQSQILTGEIYPWPEKKDVPAEHLYENIGKLLSIRLKNMGIDYPGYSFSLNGCGLPGGWHDLNNLRKLLQDPANPFFDWSRQSIVIKKIQTFQPDWIGISVTFEDQLLPALCIASSLKKEDKKTTVILGGALFTTFQDYINEETPFWDLIDGIIIGPGEDALTGLKYIGGKWIPARNLRIFSTSGWLADFLNETDKEEGFPDYDHLPLKQYWSPGIILPYRILSRCSWNRCSFCADARYSIVKNQMNKCIGERIEVMYSLVKRYGAQGIYFVDAELTVDTMKLLANATEDLSFVWGGNARFTPFLTSRDAVEGLYRGGCRVLRLGLESASISVLKRMNKGITLDVASKVLKNLGESRITTHVYLMKDFPMETEDDWNKTVDFVKQHARWIDMISISGFALYEKSPIWYELIDNGRVVSKAVPDCWTYPEIQGLNKMVLNADEVDGMVNMILDRHRGSRSCLTTAHTLILSDKFSRGLYFK